jgi:hypothetical protein
MEDEKVSKEKLDEIFKNMVENVEDRFSFGPSDVALVTDDGRKLYGTEVDEYIKQKKIDNTKVSEQLSVGDVVKLTYIDVPLTIVRTKFDGGDSLYGSDYGGESELDTSQIVLFDQDEIESVISKGTKVK